MLWLAEVLLLLGQLSGRLYPLDVRRRLFPLLQWRVLSKWFLGLGIILLRLEVLSTIRLEVSSNGSCFLE